MTSLPVSPVPPRTRQCMIKVHQSISTDRAYPLVYLKQRAAQSIEDQACSIFCPVTMFVSCRLLWFSPLIWRRASYKQCINVDGNEIHANLSCQLLLRRIKIHTIMLGWTKNDKIHPMELSHLTHGCWWRLAAISKDDSPRCLNFTPPWCAKIMKAEWKI